jgi:hypothetical protein
VVWARYPPFSRTGEVDVDAAEMLWSCFAGLPTGWSWGLYFCQEALCCRRAMRSDQSSSYLMADRAPAPKLPPTSRFCAPYVHDGNVVAGSAEAAGRLLEVLKTEMSTAGFAFHEEVGPTRALDPLGRTLDLESRVPRPSRRRMWRLWFGVDDVVRRPSLSPDQLGFCSGMLFSRWESRSILRHSCAFVGYGGAEVSC